MSDTKKLMDIDIVACIIVCGVDESGAQRMTCGFIEDDHGELSLPQGGSIVCNHVAELALDLFREYIDVDIRTLDIVPGGFFDPLKPDLHELDKESRTITLSYNTRIHPGTPVHSKLRFLDHEEISVARGRITRGHYQAYRAAMFG